jgi:hypothetical protein
MTNLDHIMELRAKLTSCFLTRRERADPWGGAEARIGRTVLPRASSTEARMDMMISNTCSTMFRASPNDGSSNMMSFGFDMIARPMASPGDLLPALGQARELRVDAVTILVDGRPIRDWGVRDLEAVVQAARENGLDMRQVVEMAANNLSVVFRHSTADHLVSGEPPIFRET